MSSLRVRAQNKLLSKLGAAKPSKNIQFDNAYSGFEKAQVSLLGLESALRGFIVSLKGFHTSAQVLYGAIEAIGGTPENSPEMRNGVAELRSAFLSLDVTALDDSVKRFESRVMQPTAGWVAEAVALKNQVVEFNEEKLVYDHYTRKVMSLREARDKRSASGKQEKVKDVEKLVRNEQKLAATTTSYSKISEATVANLRAFVNSKETQLTPIVQRVLEFRVDYALRVANESRAFQKLIQDASAIEGVICSMESLAGQLAGGGDRQLIDQASDPDLPVQALSFESFVGEAPLQLATLDTATPMDWTPPEMPPVPKLMTSIAYPTAEDQAGAVHSPTSPSSAGEFITHEFTQAHQCLLATTEYHSGPVQTARLSITPWDDISPNPAGLQASEVSNFDGTQIRSITSPTAPLDWEGFDNVR